MKTIPYVQLIGMELVDLSGGEAIFKLKMREQLRQPHGLLHGGATASIIDGENNSVCAADRNGVG